jgi:hypothetical protein
MDTRAQNSWKELIEKEASTRIQCKLKLEETAARKNEDEWFVRSKYTQVPAAITTNTPTRPATATNADDMFKPLVFPPRPVRKNIAQEVERLSEQLRLSGANLLTDMRPPQDQVVQLLYDGFSKEGKGRSQYMRARKHDSPEAKYEYPLVSSFDYGWKLDEVGQKYSNPIHGRSKIVEDSFYRRNGVF